MASHRVGDSGSALSDHIPYAIPHMLHHPNTDFLNQEGPAFDFGELEEAIVLQEFKTNNNDETKQALYSTVVRPAATLEMFPSWPMRFKHQTTRGNSKSGEESTDSVSAVNTLSSNRLEPESPVSRKPTSDQLTAAGPQHRHLPPPQMEMGSGSDSPRTGSGSLSQPAARQSTRRGPGSNSDKVQDAKTLRRLAQNREAAKKSRLRKKAYVQQLESSRIRLTQLEQDLHRARSQGLFLGGGGHISSGGAIFDMEYARWVEDDHRHMSELRTGIQAQLSDGDLRVIVDGYLSHYDELFEIKGIAAKSDVFHLINGTWTTPAERCFLWMGGFRPSDIIKMLIAQLDPLTDQQVVGIYSLQQSSQQAEEALSQGLEQLQQSLIDTITTGSLNDTMHQMAVALGKLSNLEGFVRQADNLRQQTLHQLQRILTVRQGAKCFLVIGEYYGRLRALSSLWASRPREPLIIDANSCQTTTDFQILQSAQNQFSNF